MLETLIYRFILLLRSISLTQYSRYIHLARLNMTIAVAIPLALACIHTSGKAMDGQGEARDNQRECLDEPRVPKSGQERPQMSQERSKKPQEEPKIGPEAAQARPKECPSDPKSDSKMRHEAQDNQRESLDEPRVAQD